MSVGAVHHIDLWVPSLDRAIQSYGWVLEALGYAEFQRWDSGRSWQRGGTYVAVEESTALVGREHDRLRPGVNHLAFHAGSVEHLDRLVEEAPRHGWQLMFEDRHPHAGGPDHYAAFLENQDGFEIELVANSESAIPTMT
jgi:catechol 2,3-dioxygenase-like lactoylglutathione lyase family enzyme